MEDPQDLVFFFKIPVGIRKDLFEIYAVWPFALKNVRQSCPRLSGMHRDAYICVLTAML
jgi:hypothetical protein